MKKIILIMICPRLLACASTDQNAKSLLDRLEFDDDETGCVRLTANLDLNPMPFITSNATLVYRKQKGDGEFNC